MSLLKKVAEAVEHALLGVPTADELPVPPPPPVDEKRCSACPCCSAQLCLLATETHQPCSRMATERVRDAVRECPCTSVAKVEVRS